ncbi:DUF6518 family protein [Modestobacter versicolor]|uniref:Uncharacterized membrane protein (UPF0136 family) n=1 Tax=Modestobacter versicolor TaxID=429133 RepID=A0A323VDX4_9ACTN|nr:DUF6518 family protein [Modestobacter versicolor]MBB3674891.1 uncharacterized membrane protein (UPF0136 family) [Modestobacter versicolor]PZA22927.1 hypothetical protein DMO24_02600 [Modestobacter versicolor]
MIDTAPAPAEVTQTAPRWWLPVVVLLLGAGGGVLTEWLQGVLDDPWAAWANSVAAWCLPAFAVGALAGRVRVAVVAAVATELLLVGSYYVSQYAQLLPVDGVTVAGWLVAGVLAGVVFGVAGHWWRAGEPRTAVAGAALMSGAVVGEGLYRAVAFPWQGSSGAVMAAAGVVLAVLLGRTWRQRLTVLGLLAAVVPLAWLGTVVVDAAFATW